jgi:hypothetical protein
MTAKTQRKSPPAEGWPKAEVGFPMFGKIFSFATSSVIFRLKKRKIFGLTNCSAYEYKDKTSASRDARLVLPV